MKQQLLYLGTVLAALLSGVSGMSASDLGTPTLTPSPETAVKSISTIKISYSLSNEDNLLAIPEDQVSEITLLREGDSDPITCSGVETDWESWPLNTLILSFGNVAEPGQYTLAIPEGTIHEASMDWETWETVFSDTDPMNPALEVIYTVSADAPSILDSYTLDPSPSEPVASISAITISFSALDQGDYSLQVNDEAAVTISNGDVTYKGTIGGWGNQRSFYFMDENDDDVTIGTPGTWELKVEEGAFIKDGDVSPEITAEYTITNFTCEPANGSVEPFNDEYASHVYFYFNGPLTMEGADGSPTVFQVEYAGNQVPCCANLSDALSRGGYYYTAASYGDPEIHFVFAATVFTKPGVLTIRSDEGDFTVNGKPSPAIDYTVTYGEVREYTYSIFPESGATLAAEDLAEILVSFPDATSAAVSSTNFYAILRTSSWIAPEPEVTAVEGSDYPVFSVKFPITQTIPGSYSLLIDEGSFVLDGNQDSPAITARYTVSKSADEVNTDWSPSPTGKVLADAWGTYVAIVFDENESVSYGENFSSRELYFNGEAVSISDYTTRIESPALMINLEKEPYVGMTGTLRLVAPEGMLSISGVPSPAIEYTWEVVAERDYTWTFTPDPDAETVSSLAEINMYFNDAETVGLSEYPGVSLRKSDYSYFASAEIEEFEFDGHPALKFTFDPAPTVAGEYTLSITYGTLLFDGVQSNENISVKYNFDSTFNGITAVGDNRTPVSYTVVTADGRVVLNGASADALGNLAPGFYIVNGKKTVVK